MYNNVDFSGRCTGQRASVEYPLHPHFVPSYLWASSQPEDTVYTKKSSMLEIADTNLIYPH